AKATARDGEDAVGHEDLEQRLLAGREAHSPDEAVADDPELKSAIANAQSLIEKAGRVEAGAHVEDADELNALLGELRAAVARRSRDEIARIAAKVEDIVFYLEDV
ncbi:MAG TPA: hypothetical protein VGX78_02720, partial [Pirellulales bacterium]|nr:hypothetical protein [Pirellulales bacterium]